MEVHASVHIVSALTGQCPVNSPEYKGVESSHGKLYFCHGKTQNFIFRFLQKKKKKTWIGKQFSNCMKVKSLH